VALSDHAEHGARSPRDQARHAGPSVDSLAFEESPDLSFVVPASADTIDDAALARIVLEHFDTLPRRQRQIFELADIKGHSPHEIAKELGMKPVTVRASLFKARRTIRTRMLKQHPDLLSAPGRDKTLASGDGFSR